MKRVVLESPYKGKSKIPPIRWIQEWQNRRYARRAVRDSLRRGEAPIASHLLYTQRGILRDQIPVERGWGISAGLAWGPVAEATVVYVDRGTSTGMKHGINEAAEADRPVELRVID